MLNYISPEQPPSPRRGQNPASSALNGRNPLAVSLLYATGHVPNLGCQVSQARTGFEEPTLDEVAFQQRFLGSRRSRPAWEEVLAAEYPVNALRSLARDMVPQPAPLPCPAPPPATSPSATCGSPVMCALDHWILACRDGGPTVS